jgi:hypothetical protein
MREIRFYDGPDNTPDASHLAHLKVSALRNPNDMWLWANMFDYNLRGDYYRPCNAKLRDIGYVFWDSARLQWPGPRGLFDEDITRECRSRDLELSAQERLAGIPNSTELFEKIPRRHIPPQSELEQEVMGGKFN